MAERLQERSQMRERQSGQKHQVFVYQQRWRRTVSSQGQESCWSDGKQTCISAGPKSQCGWEWGHSGKASFHPGCLIPTNTENASADLQGTYLPVPLLKDAGKRKVRWSERRGDQKGKDAVKQHLSSSLPYPHIHQYFFSNPFSAWKANNGHVTSLPTSPSRPEPKPPPRLPTGLRIKSHVPFLISKALSDLSFPTFLISFLPWLTASSPDNSWGNVWVSSTKTPFLAHSSPPSHIELIPYAWGGCPHHPVSRGFPLLFSLITDSFSFSAQFLVMYLFALNHLTGLPS